MGKKHVYLGLKLLTKTGTNGQGLNVIISTLSRHIFFSPGFKVLGKTEDQETALG